jgi:polyhydroxyalkanoate synthesis repressor PhaR
MSVIKRYPNRKLYNTELKQYITLDELADLIRLGDEIRVIDHASGEDLTTSTLAQIIFEQAKKQTGFVPLGILSSLIKTGGDRLTAIEHGLISTLGLKRVFDEEIQRRLQLLVERGDLSAEQGFELLTKLCAFEAPIRPIEFPIETVVEKVLVERGVPDQNDIHILLERLDALASNLEGLGNSPKPPDS